MSDSAMEQKAVELISNLEKLAEPAMQVTLQAVRVGAIIDLLLSAMCLALLAFLWIKFAPRVIEYANESDYDAEVPLMLGGLTAVITTAILAFAALISLFNTSNWLAVFSPEMALARLLIEKVG